MQHQIYFDLKKLDPELAIHAPKYLCLQSMFALSFMKYYNPKRAVF